VKSRDLSGVLQKEVFHNNSKQNAEKRGPALILHDAVAVVETFSAPIRHSHFVIAVPSRQI
jgi:hypothetical protein